MEDLILCNFCDDLAEPAARSGDVWICVHCADDAEAAQ